MRLASLYATLERIRSAELRVAESEVDDAAFSAAIAGAASENQRDTSRQALASGEREEWQIAETARSAIEMRIVRLARLRIECEATRDAAVMRHRLSRLQVEQMDSVAERRQAREALEETRQQQAESDDRFAARRAWQSMKSR